MTAGLDREKIVTCMNRSPLAALSTFRHLTAPQIRYLLVGGAMAMLFALFVWVYHAAGLHGWAASMLATASVAGPTFALHRYFTFVSPGPMLGQLVGFVSTVAFNVPVGAVTVYMLLDVLGIHPFISGLGATVVASLLNYVVLSKLVFKRVPV
jgi:putative flippase GtrA